MDLYKLVLISRTWWGLRKQIVVFPKFYFQRLSLQRNYLSLEGKSKNNQVTKRINRSDFQQLSMKT